MKPRKPKPAPKGMLSRNRADRSISQPARGDWQTRSSMSRLVAILDEIIKKGANLCWHPFFIFKPVDGTKACRS
ncbi:hypothetical protein SAMN04515647_0290 [Cohaesibacter sp. ES.047]|nr:hypothetical protein SAMN04515647_0290 [Cohaesibacter sp. ES.047]